MDNIIQARHNFALAFQHCWNGKEFPNFRKISVSELGDIHTGYLAIGLLDEALDLKPDFQEAHDLRGDIWHAILIKNFDENYQRYIDSKAWSETRNKYFDQFGRLCPCGITATQLHHKTYDNVGKENLLTDLNGFCDVCHQETHQSRIPNRANDVRGKDYWDKFKAYVEENGNQLQLFPEPDLPSFYGIQIDQKTRKSVDRHKDGAVWLVAYRSADKLQANLCMQSSTHYSRLRKQKDIIKDKFEFNLGELKWEDDKKRIGFSNNNVRNVKTANTDQEFSWLHDRLIRLHEVFQPRVLGLQEGDTNAT